MSDFFLFQTRPETHTTYRPDAGGGGESIKLQTASCGIQIKMLQTIQQLRALEEATAQCVHPNATRKVSKHVGEKCGRQASFCCYQEPVETCHAEAHDKHYKDGPLQKQRRP